MPEPHILDRRPALQSFVEHLWNRWDAAPPSWAAAAMRRTGEIVDRTTARRAARRPAPPADRLVVSVGNLRVGGTGKTPVVRHLMTELAQRGVAGVVATRGYGSGRGEPCRVTPDDAGCGDEARLLAADDVWRVFQSSDRRAGYALAVAATPHHGVLLLEDAHQSSGVPRHHDILIVDRWDDGPATGAVLPWGPYREGPAGAERASLLVVDADQVPNAPSSWRGRPVCRFRRRTVLPGGVDIGERPCAVVSGLANPGGFEAACASILGCPPVLAARYPDHAPYRPSDVGDLLRAGDTAGVAVWLTTGKDHGKLAVSWPTDRPLVRVELALDWDGPSPADHVAGWLPGD